MSELSRASFAPPPLREEVGRQEGRLEGSQQEVSHLRAVSSAGNGQKTKSPRPADFNALVRPLENLHPAWRLRDPGLGWCLVMFREAPDKFALCVELLPYASGRFADGRPAEDDEEVWLEDVGEDGHTLKYG